MTACSPHRMPRRHRMDIIHKGAGDLKLTPNFTDYETTRGSFT